MAPSGASEARVFDLVARIEGEFARPRFEDVYASLLAIHGGQVRSLAQQDDPRLGDDEIVAISCEKGGSSVLADLYLVSGRASAKEERFAFGYGVFLQLLDDLQDVTRRPRGGAPDPLHPRRAARPSRRAGRSPRRLHRPGARRRGDPGRARASPSARTSSGATAGPSWSAAIGEQPERFTRRFRRGIEGQWPFSFRAMRRLRRRAERRFARAADTLRRRTGEPSLLDLALREA